MKRLLLWEGRGGRRRRRGKAAAAVLAVRERQAGLGDAVEARVWVAVLKLKPVQGLYHDHVVVSEQY